MHNKTLCGFLVFSRTRDIFFGFALKPGARMELKDARRVFSYPKHPECGGPDALAVYGPWEGVQAGPAVPMIYVENVVNSVLCTEQAVEAWKKKDNQW